MSTRDRLKAKSSVIRVVDGRGFVVQGPDPLFGSTLLVVTAAHCLPFLPPCHGASHLHEKTYKKLLAPLGQKPSIWCECLFADPIADLAILGSPDDQELSEEAEAYEALTERAAPLEIIDATRSGRAWLLSLKGMWFRCSIRHNGQGPLLVLPNQPTRGGMSGSPIISDEGAAMGVVVLGSVNEPLAPTTKESANVRLRSSLPGWLLYHKKVAPRRLREIRHGKRIHIPPL
jgi:hypothetical protein